MSDEPKPLSDEELATVDRLADLIDSAAWGTAAREHYDSNVLRQLVAEVRRLRAPKPLNFDPQLPPTDAMLDAMDKALAAGEGLPLHEGPSLSAYSGRRLIAEVRRLRERVESLESYNRSCDRCADEGGDCGGHG